MRKLPVKLKQIQLVGEWEGWEFTARTNPTMATLEEMGSGDIRRICGALGKVVTEWNFVDEDGNPLINPRESESPEDLILSLPLDLATAMAQSISGEIVSVPPA
jgi:hypothetical protein